MDRLIQLAIGFVVLGALLWPIELLYPSVRGKRVFRKGFRVDLIYWFFTPTISAGFTFGVTVVTGIAIILLSGGEIDRANLATGRAPISLLPTGLQYLTALVAADFLGYFAHRLFHLGKLWDFHAIHHGSEELDWLSAVRLHPVNQALGQVMIVAPLALLGFNLKILGVTSGLLTFWAIFVHSNVRWTFGPLRHWIATPAFHRWHHTSQSEGLNKNFGGLFLFWDRLFGTLYLPAEQPQHFGVPGEAIPSSFLRQLLWPFARLSTPRIEPGERRATSSVPRFR
jgi:sterol desaturase/sphingolipid hydroxylase (fatty acid hydroxylase superfamily)